MKNGPVAAAGRMQADGKLGMGDMTAFARLTRKVPLAALAATAMIAASTSSVDFQDLAEHPHAVMQDGVRWTASIPAPPSFSEHSTTFRFADTGPVSGGLLQAAGEPVSTGSVSGQPFDATIQRVNRAAKGDFMSSRPPQTRVEREVPTSGAIWELKDIFSSYQGDGLPKVALAPAAAAPPDDVMLAYNTFLKPERVTERANIMVARVEAKPASPTPINADTEPGTAVSLVAYAPAAVELDAPFGALLDSAPAQALTPVLPPRGRPAKVNTARFMTGHGPHRRRPGEHKWAANALPAHAFKQAQQACLARGIYFEARGEPVRGQAGVAQVILNRVKNPAYPSTICGVVYQNKKWRNRCQFSFACDGIRDRIRSTKLYKTAQYVAREVTAGNIWLPEVGDATHYHATYVRPRWARKMKKTDRIGRHIFYRTKNGGWS